MTQREFLASVSAKTDVALKVHFNALYDDLLTTVGDINLIQLGIRYGVEIGAAAVIETLIDGGLLQMPDA